MNIAEVAALDFAPMDLDGNMTPTDFRAGAASVYTALGVSVALLGKGPTELAELLVRINPEKPDEAADEIAAARVWLQGLVDILACAEARAMIALARTIN